MSHESHVEPGLGDVYKRLDVKIAKVLGEVVSFKSLK